MKKDSGKGVLGEEQDGEIFVAGQSFWGKNVFRKNHREKK